MAILIGITTSLEEQEQRLHLSYVRAVEQAGGIPLIVPMLESEAALAEIVDLLDGLIITGGPAIIDGLIGDLPEDISRTDPVRLAADAHVLRAVLATRKPILGICYGMQLINAWAGGTIYADVQRQQPGAQPHSPKRGADYHPLSVLKGSTLADVLKTDALIVNTRHIQALATVGNGLRVTATAPDGTIEAIENEEGTLLGVQFHPERMGDTMTPLFEHLIETARLRQRTHALP